MKLTFGRIAPVEPQREQVSDGGGFVWRYKVRIFEKHTEDKTILPDSDLPWAQVMLPVTAGSGAANYAQSPQINQGDTVSIAYFDNDEQMPVIMGILPRTQKVATAEPADSSGYIPHTGYTEYRGKNSKIPEDESNEQSKSSQPSPQMATFSSATGDTTVSANTCDPNEYKTLAINSEINNLFNQIGQVADNAAKVESLISNTVDRVHALVNPYVGQIFSGVFNALVPVLNAGLSALYKAVFAKVLAATQNPIAARLAAEAALIALRPAILALQEAISLIANAIVRDLYRQVDDLVRDTVDNNDNFTSCAGTQFNGALVNSIIGQVDSRLGPLLDAVQKVLSGGFNVSNEVRSSLDIISDLAGGLLASNQGGNKCRGRVKQYAFGIGPLDTAGDILGDVLDAANTGAGLISKGGELVANIGDLDDDAKKEFLQEFGSFPFLSINSGSSSDLDLCSTDKPQTCFGPEVFIFGGRGYGATAKAIVGDYVQSTDDRSVSDVQGGVVSVEVLDGGIEYSYPPFVEIRDNCGLGIGAVARSVIKDGKVVRIYIVTPGEGYISNEGEQLFVVGTVQIINGGSGYGPGIVRDPYGGEYELVVDEDGSVIDILPINIVQVPDNPVIDIPEYTPPLPPGGTTREIDGELFIVDVNGNVLGRVSKGVGLNYKTILTVLPKADAILAGDIPPAIAERVSQEEIQQIIDCIQH